MSSTQSLGLHGVDCRVMQTGHADLNLVFIKLKNRQKRFWNKSAALWCMSVSYQSLTMSFYLLVCDLYHMRHQFFIFIFEKEQEEKSVGRGLRNCLFIYELFRLVREARCCFTWAFQRRNYWVGEARTRQCACADVLTSYHIVAWRQTLEQLNDPFVCPTSRRPNEDKPIALHVRTGKEI